ncbi:C69 family dipeptidase [Enterococcus malodoratus]|uniref:C69 family dipeptidase n=1 Tax=Enterococcus malodoratus TaxID=71451 RepID=UPI0039B0E344
MKRENKACTTLLVGKKAASDGSTMIARIEDGFEKPNPQHFVVVSSEQQPRRYCSSITSFELDLPQNPLRYTSTPDLDDRFGIWAGGGINSQNVAMTACETITNNDRILAIDPLVDTGIGEADFITLVLPYIHSAKEGVLRLGQLIETYGTYEINGIAFSDSEEIWYLETIGGHHWAAVRIPDDAFVFVSNRLAIDHFDFNSPDNLSATGLQDLIEKHQLNPTNDELNLRDIFGTFTNGDQHYNNPRVWYIQKVFCKNNSSHPEDQDLPFLAYPDKKLTIEDVRWALSSHYQNTPYDPYGEGEMIDKSRYRSIALNRNEETHILQIRNNVSKEIAAIHWLAFGPNTFNTLVPFYANITKTPTIFNEIGSTFKANDIYWLSKAAALLGDSNFSRFETLRNDTVSEAMIEYRKIQLATDSCEVEDDQTIQDHLEIANNKMAEIALTKMNGLLGEMIKRLTIESSLDNTNRR